MPCSCQKSGCTNNRCSCYSEDEPCTSECTCEGCDNQGDAPTVAQEEKEGEEDVQDEDLLLGCTIFLVIVLVAIYLIFT